VTESDDERGCEGCMRARVKLDILKPLCRGRKVHRVDGTELWISFKYGCLPNYCYWCGLLTHAEKDCVMWLRSKGTLRRDTQQYGAWLRAPMDKPIRRVEVRAECRSNVPRWGQPQPTPFGPSTEGSPVPGASSGAPADKAGSSLGLDTSKETTMQSPEIIRSSVDNLEQHLLEIDLALKSPLSSRLAGNKGFDQSTPLEHDVLGNSQDPVINAPVNLYAKKQPAGGWKS
jgi:hypothetical protein